jgi:signal transduction histidine kinase
MTRVWPVPADIPASDTSDDSVIAAALSALALPVVVLAHGPDMAEPLIVHTNDALTAWTGLNAGQLAGTPFLGLFDAPETCTIAASLTAVLSDHMPQQCETVLRLRHGDSCAVALAFTPMPTGTGGQTTLRHATCLIQRLSATPRNVRIRTAGLDPVAKPLLEIVNTLNEGIVLYDHDDRLVFCNQSIHEMYPERARLYRRGARREDLLRASAQEQISELAGLSILEFVEQGRRKAIDVDAEREVQLRDGRIIRIGRRRTASGMLAIHTDITELKRTYRFLSDAIEAMSEGFALYGPDDRLVVCNSRLRALHKGAADILVPGTPFTTILRRMMEIDTWTATPDNLDAYVEQRAQRRREIGENVIERSMSDGRWLRISGKLLPDGQYVAIHTDITEQKRRELDLYNAKQSAEQANHAKSSFLANVSHELRTPMNAILGFSEVMAGEMFGPLGNARYVEYMGDIHSSAHHLLALINDLLDMSKIEAGKYTLHDEYFDLAPLAEECLRQIEPQRAAANIVVTTDIPADLPQLRADVRSMRQVLINLLSKAVKFSSPGGTIAIRVRVDAGAIVFDVSDTGIGIRQEDLERLTKPFQQVDKPMARSAQGTGLGLSISRSLVEMHGGTLQIDSTFGEGTTVTVTLPASRNAAEAY